MCDTKLRGWYFARHKGAGRILHLVSATSIEKARLLFGPLSREYDFTAATWSMMKGEIGMVSPMFETTDGIATGSIIWDAGRKTISIDIAD